LKEEVAIVSVGCVGFQPVTPELSHKEIMFEAAVRAYEEVGVNPRRDINAFVTCAEDYWEDSVYSMSSSQTSLAPY